MIQLEKNKLKKSDAYKSLKIDLKNATNSSRLNQWMDSEPMTVTLFFKETKVIVIYLYTVSECTNVVIPFEWGNLLNQCQRHVVKIECAQLA